MLEGTLFPGLRVQDALGTAATHPADKRVLDRLIESLALLRIAEQKDDPRAIYDASQRLNLALIPDRSPERGLLRRTVSCSDIPSFCRGYTPPSANYSEKQFLTTSTSLQILWMNLRKIELPDLSARIFIENNAELLRRFEVCYTLLQEGDEDVTELIKIVEPHLLGEPKLRALVATLFKEIKWDGDWVTGHYHKTAVWIACVLPNDRVAALKQLRSQRLFDSDLLGDFAGDVLCEIAKYDGPIANLENNEFCCELSAWLAKEGPQAKMPVKAHGPIQQLVNYLVVAKQFKAVGVLCASGAPVPSDHDLECLGNKDWWGRVYRRNDLQRMGYPWSRLPRFSEQVIQLFRSGDLRYPTLDEASLLIEELVKHPRLRKEIVEEELSKEKWASKKKLLLMYALGEEIPLSQENEWDLPENENLWAALPIEALRRLTKLVASKRLNVPCDFAKHFPRRDDGRLSNEARLLIKIASGYSSFKNYISKIAMLLADIDVEETKSVLSDFAEEDRRRAWLYLSLVGSVAQQEFACDFLEAEGLGAQFVSSSASADDGPLLLGHVRPSTISRLVNVFEKSFNLYTKASLKVIKTWTAYVLLTEEVRSPKACPNLDYALLVASAVIKWAAFCDSTLLEQLSCNDRLAADALIASLTPKESFGIPRAAL